MPAQHATRETAVACSNGEPSDYKVGSGTRQVRGGARGAVLGMACVGLSKSDGAAHHAEKHKRLRSASSRTAAPREAGLPAEFRPKKVHAVVVDAAV